MSGPVPSAAPAPGRTATALRASSPKLRRRDEFVGVAVESDDGGPAPRVARRSYENLLLDARGALRRERGRGRRDGRSSRAVGLPTRRRRRTAASVLGPGVDVGGDHHQAVARAGTDGEPVRSQQILEEHGAAGAMGGGGYPHGVADQPAAEDHRPASILEQAQGFRQRVSREVGNRAYVGRWHRQGGGRHHDESEEHGDDSRSGHPLHVSPARATCRTLPVLGAVETDQGLSAWRRASQQCDPKAGDPRFAIEAGRRQLVLHPIHPGRRRHYERRRASFGGESDRETVERRERREQRIRVLSRPHPPHLRVSVQSQPVDSAVSTTTSSDSAPTPCAAIHAACRRASRWVG